jgi:hypothetical protein
MSAEAKTIYECLRQASNDLFPTGEEVASYEEYDGLDKQVYERAGELMKIAGVSFPDTEE